MNKLNKKQRALIINLLVEGNSLRSTATIADASRNTVDKLLKDAGRACINFQDETIRNLTCNRIQCDEIWSFVGMKQKNVPDELKDEFGYGNIYILGPLSMLIQN